MTVFLNGQFVPEADAKVSVFDRSFLYGDGLFETVRISNRKPFRLMPHLERLEQGAAFLGITLPYSAVALSAYVAELIARNTLHEALLRITLSRGVGVRGYSPKGADKPMLVMSLHPFGAPDSVPAGRHADPEIGATVRWRAHTASVRLPAGDALAQFKTCNKLMQVVARAEADAVGADEALLGDALAQFKTCNKLMQVVARAEAEAVGADEALLLNTDGSVVEATSGNLFWVQAGRVCTPPLAAGILRGITRGVVLEICQQLQVPVQEAHIQLEELRTADAVFLSLSSFGVVELADIDGHKLAGAPVLAAISKAYHALVREECA
jgi:branched-subunit amino acid aminotransferase/4-amino-4-deoxychorismate lyase